MKFPESILSKIRRLHENVAMETEVMVPSKENQNLNEEIEQHDLRVLNIHYTDEPMKRELYEMYKNLPPQHRTPEEGGTNPEKTFVRFYEMFGGRVVVTHEKPTANPYGLPQGSPTSPILSVLGLIGTIIFKGKKVFSVLYADDGLYYGDFNGKPTGLRGKEKKLANIRVAEEKSG